MAFPCGCVVVSVITGFIDDTIFTQGERLFCTPIYLRRSRAVQCRRPRPRRPRRFRHVAAGAQQLPRFLLDLRGQFRLRPRPRLAPVEARRSVPPVLTHVSFHRPKRRHHFAGPRLAAGHHLPGNQPETLQVLSLVLEHRQMSVQLHHLALRAPHAQIPVDLFRSGRKNRQLQCPAPPLPTADGQPVRRPEHRGAGASLRPPDLGRDLRLEMDRHLRRNGPSTR